MICKRCGNKDPRYFYYGSRGYYCRKCVSFKRMLLEDDLVSYDYDVSKDSYEYNFDYPLTVYQQDISDKCAFNVQYKDVLLKAVCGAGKTEIVVESISNYLKRGLKVCYAIARREVVIDLYQRFKTIFNNAVATLESVSLIPHFASMAVNPANSAEPNANNSHIFLHPNRPFHLFHEIKHFPT